MSTVAFTNFTSGLVSPKLAGNYSSTIYHNGCAELENFVVMLQGGVTRRPPLEALKTVSGSRLIPFILDSSTSYAVELGYNTENKSGFFKMWSISDAATLTAEGTTVFAQDEIESVQFAQSNSTLYLAHENHTPQKLHLSSGSWQMDSIEPYLVRVKNPDGSDSGVVDDKDNIGMLTAEGDHPRCVAYLYNRLWFASSIEHPYRLWASRPFKPENFEMYELVKTVDDSATAQSIIDAIETGDESITITTSYKWTKTIREDNAMLLDAQSNDAIRWLASYGNLVVGTSSGESIISGSCNALNQSLTAISAYGSAEGRQAIVANSEVLFLQSGANTLRSLVYSSGSYSVLDLTYQCDRILDEHGSAVRMAWRRVSNPTLYVTLKDGTLAVLSYDRGYGLCAWSHWTFTGAKIKDVCILDTEQGQDVIMLVDRSGVLSLEKLSNVDAAEGLEVQYKDCGLYEYTSTIKTNPYEVNSSYYGSSLGKKKRMRSITCRLYNSKSFIAGYDERYMKPYSGSVGLMDKEIVLPGGYEDFVQMKVSSSGSDALTILAFAVETEVDR